MKFQIGQKVTPIAKTVEGYGDLECCSCWQDAREAGNNFLYIVDYNKELGCYVLDTEENSISGNFYNESDLVEYVEKPKVTFEDLEKGSVRLSNDIFVQVNQMTEEHFLKNCNWGEKGIPVWFSGLEQCTKETLHYDDIVKLHKFFGDIIQFVNEREEPKKEMTLEQIEKELGYKVKLV